MKATVALSALVAGFLMSANALAADPAVVATTASAAVRASEVATRSTVTGTKGATTGKINAQASTTIKNSSGNSQYPTGTPVVPPKPKKEGMPAINTNIKAAP